jgi:hypothetical protein
LAGIPEGGKAAFAAEIDPVGVWRGQVFPAVADGLDSAALGGLAGAREDHLEQGRRCLETVVGIRDRRREEQARELLSQWERLCSDVVALGDVGRRWRPEGWCAIEAALAALPGAMDRGEFLPVREALAGQRQALDHLAEEAAELQRQDEQRRVVLEALRAVCGEMGWDEEGAPVLEHPDDPASAILLAVQTWSAGIMRFTLTLEGIRVESPISREGRVCHSQFGKISEKLRNFGVLAQFRTLEGGDEEPELRARGELEIPDEGENLYREA